MWCHCHQVIQILHTLVEPLQPSHTNLGCFSVKSQQPSHMSSHTRKLPDIARRPNLAPLSGHKHTVTARVVFQKLFGRRSKIKLSMCRQRTLLMVCLLQNGLAWDLFACALSARRKWPDFYWMVWLRTAASSMNYGVVYVSIGRFKPYVRDTSTWGVPGRTCFLLVEEVNEGLAKV